MQLRIADITFDSSVYPKRKSGQDRRRVAQYAARMREGVKFDPVEVEPAENGQYSLLNGWHRIEALKEIGEEEVEADVITLDGESPLLYAARQHPSRGELTDADARDVAERVFDENPRVTNRELAAAVGRSEATIHEYLKERRAKHEAQQDLAIFKMHLLGIPQERIASRLGMERETIRNHLAELSRLKNRPNELIERGFQPNTIAEKEGWPESLVWAVALEGKEDRERFAALRWSIRPWDYWSWGDVDHRFGDSWPGRIPAQLVAHALYFFTRQEALVFDPMAGGGVTPDVCLALNRRCWAFDMADRPDLRPEIEPHHWKPLSWPVAGKSKPDFIFFDPPYYKKMEERYGESSISALPRSEYLAFFREWASLAAAHSKGSTRLALLVADWRCFESTAALDEDPGEAITIFDYFQELGRARWELTHRIEAPLSSERFTGNMISAMQGRRSLGTVGRTLLVFRRANGRD